MPKYRGRVDCVLSPVLGDGTAGSTYSSIMSRLVGESFVNIVDHISSSGPALGIEMIAANYGIGGTGLDFWDSATPAGRRAWACFRFHSASLGKFDCLVFEQTGTINVAYGSPVTINGNTTVLNNSSYGTNYGLGICFASHPSGSNTTLTNGPWNGTYSLTSASIGDPIWKVNSAGKGAFFPRNNGILGNFSGSRNWLSPVFDVVFDTNNIDPRPTRQHIITSEDSLTIITDISDNTTHKILHFGSFLPRSGTTCESPYIMFTNAQDNDLPIPLWAETFGYIGAAAGAGTAYDDGGIAHPNLASGSKVAIGNSISINNLVGYNIFVNSGSYETVPLWATMYEAADNYGILGVWNHIMLGSGMNNRSVSEASSSAAFGRSTLNERKMIVPWSGDPPGTSPSGRLGRNFSIG